MMRRPLRGIPLVPGTATGRALTTDVPLSLWGGLDPETGEVIDRRHPWSGQKVTGRVLCLPFGRGSCSASGVLLEAIRNGTAPAAIIVTRIDPILGLGAILGDELYDRAVPVVLLPQDSQSSFCNGDLITISADGALDVEQPSPDPCLGAS
jgi:predicted aconitase with swiveling domain